MNTLIVWVLLTVGNTNGITTEKPQLLFPTQVECEKVRVAELRLVQQMQASTWVADANTGRYIQNKCEQVTVLVNK